MFIRVYSNFIQKYPKLRNNPDSLQGMNNQTAGCSRRRIIHSKEKEKPNYYMSDHQMTPWRNTLGEKTTFCPIAPSQHF